VGTGYSDSMTNAEDDQVPPVSPTTPVAAPRWGEYSAAGAAGEAPPSYQTPPTYQTPGTYQSYPAVAPSTYQPLTPQRKSRTADIAVTSVLLALGAIGTLVALFTASSLGDVLRAEYLRYGLVYGGAPASLQGLGAVIAISHGVLYLAALGIAIPLLLKRRIAFWVPLVAGVLAAIVYWGSIIALITGDPQLMNEITPGR
jgi:hypothetical protein